MDQIKVLYIAGSNRCGSTLLARVLGDLPDFVTIGEALVHYFSGSSQDHVPCGCGLDVNECSFWKRISFPVDADPVAVHWLRLRRTAFLTSYLRRHPEQARQWIESVRNFYQAIAQHTKAQVIVDSSKSPCHARLLSFVPGIELYVVHLVRDPRSVAASSSRRKEWLPGTSPLRAAARWLGMTLGSAYLQTRVLKSRTLRYEDFVRDPRSAILQIVGDLGANKVATPFFTDSVVDLGPQHMLGSNPDKLQRGRTRVADRSTRLPWLHRTMVSVLTGPVLWSYGYLGGRTNQAEPNLMPSQTVIAPVPEMVAQDTKEDF